ncbi:MAG: hypothetical protein GWN01_00550 [Nitrosopumilaceae archaeon]|nr:hypothetical protein [Nitrosopumilaceae archaeon]NIT99470.1 hypothetical protein [Nitrosopumilaceae archaeon]NIU85829.1 hypothetical protein [Nitrosopumilaceae archaeon]NIV64686.1 hypothetical protein [Nitrosopumilaceae archaeon]NIX60073.1 hypothetical protein [Nitrosopumilaceae archaeon]
MDYSEIETNLTNEIKLSKEEARVFLIVTTKGKMSSNEISNQLNLPLSDTKQAIEQLIKLGGFIELRDDLFEAMHPRFTAVNMYRRICERNNMEFKRNKIVDNIGVVLEKPYDDARTK